MIWLRDKTGQIQPALDSLRRTFSQQQRRVDTQQDLQSQKINWKAVGCAISLIIFTMLLLATIIGVPVILTKLKKQSNCHEPTFPTKYLASSTPTLAGDSLAFQGTKQLCVAQASWNPKGVTVAGLSNGLPSKSLSGLQYPSDMYVYGDGTLLVADTYNNRITKWNRNAKEGILIAGTGSYGSWNTLLAKPRALTVYDDQLYVSDFDNYRIQIFTLNSNSTSPEAITLIGRYGKGSDVTQINEVNSLIAVTSSSSLLYIADSKNQRILSWNPTINSADIVMDKADISESNSTLPPYPSGLAFDQKTKSLYIADPSNNRIQKYTMNSRSASMTVAGWGELNHPNAVQLDPSGSNMFIADTLNHRILLWSDGSSQGQTIIGDGTAGNTDTQLNSPSQIGFDAEYNLYVVDTNNCRIQRFDLISNGCRH